MNQNINSMIDSVLNGSRDDFSAAFVSEIQYRINSNIVDKNVDIAKDIIKDDEKIEEARVLSKNYTFKSTSDVKKFIEAAKHTGVGGRNITIKGNSVNISNIDSDMEQVLGFLAKDMKAKIK